jgi:cytochrome c-type biogenesis protein CcmH
VHKLFLLLLTLLISVCSAQSVPGNSDLDLRMMRIAGELRCLVCQNQTLADSNAELAIDLRKQLREKLASGMSDQEVIDFMVQRYGDFVLYKPRLQPSTWLLWFGPFLILIGGLIFLVFRIRRVQNQDKS